METNKKETNNVKAEDGIWVTKFTEESAKAFVDELKRLDNNAGKPILVYIDSYGGYVDALATMISAIENTKSDIVTVCLGKAMSCGAILLSHGDKRFCTPTGRVMIHETSSGAYGNINDIKNDVEEGKRLNKFWMEILAKNCGYSLKQFNKFFSNAKRDIYLNAAQAKRFGIVDLVGYPRVEEHKKIIYKLVY